MFIVVVYVRIHVPSDSTDTQKSIPVLKSCAKVLLLLCCRSQPELFVDTSRADGAHRFHPLRLELLRNPNVDVPALNTSSMNFNGSNSCRHSHDVSCSLGHCRHQWSRYGSEAALTCVAALGLGHVDENAGAEERAGVHHPRRVPVLPLRHHRPQHERILPREDNVFFFMQGQ